MARAGVTGATGLAPPERPLLPVEPPLLPPLRPPPLLAAGAEPCPPLLLELLLLPTPPDPAPLDW